MSRLDNYLYPKIVGWNFSLDSINFATIPAFSAKKVAKLLNFLDNNNSYGTNLAETNFIEAIYPTDSIYFYGKQNEVILILNLEDLEREYGSFCD